MPACVGEAGGFADGAIRTEPLSSGHGDPLAIVSACVGKTGEFADAAIVKDPLQNFHFDPLARTVAVPDQDGNDPLRAPGKDGLRNEGVFSSTRAVVEDCFLQKRGAPAFSVLGTNAEQHREAGLDAVPDFVSLPSSVHGVVRPTPRADQALRGLIAGDACRACRGRGEKGLLGPRGFRLFRKPCKRCAGSGMADPNVDPFAPTTPPPVDGGSLLRCGALTGSVGGVAALAVAAAVTPATLVAAVGQVGRLVAKLRGTLHDLSTAERWVSDLGAYLRTMGAVLDQLGVLQDSVSAAPGLEVCLAEMAGLLERLSALVSRYGARRGVAKAWQLSDFHRGREEIMGSLSLWNATLTHTLQLLHQGALASLTAELRKTVLQATDGSLEAVP